MIPVVRPIIIVNRIITITIVFLFILHHLVVVNILLNTHQEIIFHYFTQINH